MLRTLFAPLCPVHLGVPNRAALALAKAPARISAVAIASWVLLTPTVGFSQPSATPAFEVASVKPHEFPAGAFGFGATTRESAIRISGTRITTQGTLAGLVLAAYRLRTFQISGASTLPDKTGADQIYEIDARAPGEGAPSMDQVRQMLQTLLADRFQLRFHRETKDMAAYDLVTSNPPKLKQASPEEETKTDILSASSQLMRIKFTDVAMAEFVIRIAPQFDRPLLDKTGLEGGYDFTLEYSPRPPDSAMSAREATAFSRLDPLGEGMSLVGALQQQLGLRVVQAKERADVLVIDHAERPWAN
jgi:uncharacterized protein (TIGR03435 family)